MKNMLYKEIKLALHPTSFIFMLLAAMVLIPNYPYYVTFFYTCLGLFFICLNGRENHDIFYTLTLPVKKSSVVAARFATAVTLQLIQVVLSVPFAILRNSMPTPNQAGIEPNLAFYGISLLLLGLFNITFFPQYYKDTNKIGAPFAKASILMFVALLLAEASVFAVPFMKTRIDNTDAAYIPYRLVFLAVGIVAYAALTLTAYKKSVRSFEALDQ